MSDIKKNKNNLVDKLRYALDSIQSNMETSNRFNCVYYTPRIKKSGRYTRIVKTAPTTPTRKAFSPFKYIAKIGRPERNPRLCPWIRKERLVPTKTGSPRKSPKKDTIKVVRDKTRKQNRVSQTEIEISSQSFSDDNNNVPKRDVSVCTDGIQINSNDIKYALNVANKMAHVNFAGVSPLNDSSSTSDTDNYDSVEAEDLSMNSEDSGFNDKMSELEEWYISHIEKNIDTRIKRNVINVWESKLLKRTLQKVKAQVAKELQSTSESVSSDDSNMCTNMTCSPKRSADKEADSYSTDEESAKRSLFDSDYKDRLVDMVFSSECNVH